MEPHRPRREFVKELAALGGFTALMGYSLRPAAAEPPPEVTTIRLSLFPTTCLAPQYLAEEFLRIEGFSQVAYPTRAKPINKTEEGPAEADMFMAPAPSVISAIDSGFPALALAGIHAGCYELFATERVRAVRDLKGKTVVIGARGALEHLFIASMVAYVGMNPEKDINWSIAGDSETAYQQFAAGKADAWLAFGTEPLELRAKKIGHSILSTAESQPWSQYFCCMLQSRRDFVQKYPVASKRALRAVLKATDVCASDPARAARYMAEKGYEPRYDLAFETLKRLPYQRWREANPEDTLRFYALRLHEVGMIKSTPQKIIADGTDWRFLNELKKELKA